MLIDNQSCYSILRPSIAEKFYSNAIYQAESTIKTALARKTLAFPEFSQNYEINLILFDFHNFFDGVISLTDLINMNEFEY